MNKTQLISLLVVAMANGSISFIASFTIITCIFRSNLKLSTTYRRLIFGLSSFDLIQSLSQALASVPMPKGSAVYFAAGNDITCNLQAFFTVFSTCGAMWYSLSLAIYFLMVVKYNLPDGVIRKRYEPFFHGFPISYSLICSIYIYATENFGASGPICWITSHPQGCENDPNVDCDNKGQIGADALKWIVGGVPFFTAFALNCVSCCSLCTNDEKKEPPSLLAARLSRPSHASVQRMKRISNRAIAYIVGYLLTYFFAGVYRIIELWTTPPYTIVFLSRFFFPLQGFFNVLIYTYPHVESCRRRNEEYSWARAFWEVVKSGGDSDEVRADRATRRNSLKKQQKLLEERGQMFNGAANVSANAKRSKKNDSSRLVKSTQIKAHKKLSHKLDMSKTSLDNELQLSCTRELIGGADDKIGSNQASPLHINTKHNASHHSDADPELGSMALSFGQDGDGMGEDIALNLPLSCDNAMGSTLTSCNPRNVHKEKVEEEEKREIGADEGGYH